MSATMYYDKDANPGLVDRRKVAVIGFGSQGHAHALNLKDSGVDVAVGLRSGSRREATAANAGLKVISIEDVTPLPHNGCRASKRRRV